MERTAAEMVSAWERMDALIAESKDGSAERAMESRKDSDRRRTLREEYAASGLSDELCGCDFCQFLIQAKKEGKSMVLSGANGTGKTRRLRFAAGFLRVPFVGARQFGCEFCRELTEGYDIGKAAKLTTFDSVLGRTEYHGLAIDDLGTEWGEAVVFGTRIHPMQAVLEERLDHWKEARTLLSTNLNGEELRERYGERVYSRMKECMVWVEIGGPDRRGMKEE